MDKHSQTALALFITAVLTFLTGSAQAQKITEAGKSSESAELLFQRDVIHVAPEKRRDYVTVFLSVPENRSFYGPELAAIFKTLSSHLPDKAASLASAALDPFLASHGCAEAVAGLTGLSPLEQPVVFAQNCRIGQKVVVEPDLASNTPLVYLKLAAAMEATASAGGFQDNLIHKLATRWILQPRNVLGGTTVTVTITLGAIWVEDVKVVDLQCDGKTGQTSKGCKNSLRLCGRDPLDESCASSSSVLTVVGQDAKELLLPELLSAVRKQTEPMQELLGKLNRKDLLDFTIFVDEAVPYNLVTRVFYTLLKSVDRQRWPATRVDFPQRAVSTDFVFPRAITVWGEPPAREDRRSIRVTPPSVVIDFRRLLLKMENGLEPTDDHIPPIDSSKCFPLLPPKSHDWLELNRQLVRLKEGDWAKVDSIYIGAPGTIPWRTVSQAILTSTTVRKEGVKACGLAGSSIATRLENRDPEDPVAFRVPVKLFSRVYLMVLE